MSRLRIMTFNIRTGEAEDGPNSWPLRRHLAFETIKDYHPHLLAIQEPTNDQWKELAEVQPDMEGVFQHPKDERWPDSHGEGLFYDTKRFRLIERKSFWLSKTPSLPGSRLAANHWGARVVVAAKLFDNEEERKLVFACTHFDTHPGSWLPSARIAAANLGRLAGELPIVLAGDFNCAAGSEPWLFLTRKGGFKDSWTESGHRDEGAITCHEFTGLSRLDFDRLEEVKAWLGARYGETPEFSHYRQHILSHRNMRIDWILFKGLLRATDSIADMRMKDGRCASDHYAVVSTLQWQT